MRLSDRGDKHRGQDHSRQPCRVSVVFLGLCAVLGILTLLEVHRSHHDVHELRAAAVQNEVGIAKVVNEPTPKLDTRPVVSPAQVTTAVSPAVHRPEQRTKPFREALKEFEDLLDDKDDIDPMCHVEEHADYHGEKVIKWGHQHRTDTAGDCCSACMVEPSCNVWVYCGYADGCGPGRGHKECWLKEASSKTLRDSIGSAKPDILWTSGMMPNPDDVLLGDDGDANRLKAIHDDPSNALVYLDVSIKSKPVGRIVIALFFKESPLAAENFRQLCTGERGTVPSGHIGAGGKYHLKGSAFYRIVDKFIDQSGVASDSVYGGMFKDDAGGLRLKHDRAGLLSMANTGPNTNTAHFSILMAPAPHLDGHYVIFGEVVEGMNVAWQINKCAKGKQDNAAGIEAQVIITDSGQIRGPKVMPDVPALLGRQ